MARFFVGLVLLNVGGALWVWSPLDGPRAAAEVTAPTEEVAIDAAWEVARLELQRKCGVRAHNLVGIEEVSRVSNGYRARVMASGRCG